jgi:hypothetical protein
MNSNEFCRAAEKVILKARAKNIDDVTLAYIEMIMSCVRCHEYVREVRDVSLPGGPTVEERSSTCEDARRRAMLQSESLLLQSAIKAA